MTPNEYRAAIAVLGLSQIAAGKWVGLGRRQGQRYARPGATVHGSAAKLIKLAIGLGLTPDQVDEIISKVKL